MLQMVIDTLKKTRGPVTVKDLSRDLGIQPSALTGMIEFWVQRGVLVVDGQEQHVSACGENCGCSSTWNESSECPFVLNLPPSYSLSPPRAGSRKSIREPEYC